MFLCCPHTYTRTRIRAPVYVYVYARTRGHGPAPTCKTRGLIKAQQAPLQAFVHVEELFNDMECFILLVAFLTVASADTGTFNYLDQNAWSNISAVCGDGTRQSPIDIVSADVIDNDELLDLVLEGWTEEREGLFFNKGTNVEFEPNVDESVPTTINHQGTYQVLQFHIHWGQNSAEGSEHVVDGVPASAEIHFVHSLVGDPNNGLAGNSFAVVGVQAVANSDMEISGVWSALNVTGVQAFEAEIDATVRYSDLLPDELDYYYYEGSLTTPACSEVVQWFLLKQTIEIPTAYLEQLRQVERNDGGDLLTFNYRDTQSLNNRTVSQRGGADGLRPLLSVTALSLLLLMFAVVH